MTTGRRSRPAPSPDTTCDSPRGRAVEAWELAVEDAVAAEDALRGLRERVRVARLRAGDSARRAHEALAARQEPFARGLLDAVQAYESAAGEGEARISECERRCAALWARCEALGAEIHRQGERVARLPGVRAVT